MKRQIATIVGTRPNFIKSTLLSQSFRRNGIGEALIHTGQHYDFELSQVFFKELELKKPDFYLKVKSVSHATQSGQMMAKIEKILFLIKPCAVVVYGDTNSTLAGALTSVKIHIPVVHIEAGERSGDREQPEEINRIITDHISKINCCATDTAVKNLKSEGIVKDVFFTGDIMLDLFKRYKNRAKPPFKLPHRYILVTVHRAENTENITKLKKIILSLSKLPDLIIWPIHPRTAKALSQNKIKLPKNIKTLNPVSYLEMLALESKSSRIVTDSGGIQKEAYWFGIPCVTLLSETGWTQTLGGGWNQLAGPTFNLEQRLKTTPKGKRNIKEFGNGDAAKNIVEIIKSNFF